MSEINPPLARYMFTGGVMRATSLSLFPTCLVHRSDNHLETLPLAGMTAVRVAFQRDTRKLGWGITLVLAALLMLAIAGPLGSFAGGNLSSGPQSVPVMQAIYQLLQAIASMLPVLALACVIGGGALCALGWIGGTTLLVCLPGAERLYPVRGRDTLLLDFAEALSERLMLLKR
jgi:hypothetical protein